MNVTVLSLSKEVMHRIKQFRFDKELVSECLIGSVLDRLILLSDRK